PGQAQRTRLDSAGVSSPGCGLRPYPGYAFGLCLEPCLRWSQDNGRLQRSPGAKAFASRFAAWASHFFFACAKKSFTAAEWLIKSNQKKTQPEPLARPAIRCSARYNGRGKSKAEATANAKAAW